MKHLDSTDRSFPIELVSRLLIEQFLLIQLCRQTQIESLCESQQHMACDNCSVLCLIDRKSETSDRRFSFPIQKKN